MPFKFVFLCDLLSNLEALSTRDPPLLPVTLRDRYQRTITQWFRSHRARIDALDAPSAVALLSALFPERRTDRVYGLQPPSLTKALGRCLGLGISRIRELERWKEPGRGDLGACVERVQRQAEMARCLEGREVTVEEVDVALALVAGKSRFSGPKVRGETQPTGHFQDNQPASTLLEVLRRVYTRLQSREAKWFTRMILKNFAAVVLPEGLVLRSFHFLLPDFLKVQDSFDAALGMLRGPVICKWPAMPGQDEAKRYRGLAGQLLLPKSGVKVGRANYLKARSIKHALQMAGRRRMSLERKYDGEYCQVHINLAHVDDNIQIFSKSGKDSTVDKKRVHDTIRKALRMGSADCAISSTCILEGELVVWSDKEQNILEFHKMRKHISRSGVFLGTNKDSQAHDYEHLMIIFYDLLLINNENILTNTHRERRRRLNDLITIIPGRAELVMREEIYFSSPDAPKQLQRSFAHAFTQRWEGYVLKPSDEPYFNFVQHPTDGYPGCWIKLKKDYITGLGDTADFAIVGAGYDAVEAAKKGVRNILWTHFHIGCLRDKEDVVRFGTKPSYVVVDAFNQSIQNHDLETLNELGKFRASDLGSAEAMEAFDVDIEPGLPCKMDVIFREPFVFEVMGGGFSKPPNRNYYTLRFPRVLKIHWDRDFKDTVGFDELQEMADEARSVPLEHPSQEDAAWIERLEGADKTKNNPMACWEDSQDFLQGSLELPSTSKLQSPSSRSHKAAAVPFVRMDTQEMLPTERRLDTGEISSQPSSQRSSTTVVTSASSLATPPPSSPVMTREELRKQPVGPLNDVPIANPRKRTFTEIGSQDALHPTKRHRPSPPPPRASQRSSDAPQTNSTAMDVTNASRQPRLGANVRSAEQSKRMPSSALPLVRKLGVGIEAGTHMRKETKKAVPASSCFQDTTASERSNTMPPSSPPPSLQPPQQEPPEPLLADVPAPQPRLHTPRLPVLSECQVLLSPCVAGMPYLTEDLLPFYSATYRLVSNYTAQTAALSDENLPLIPPLSGNEVVVLVECERARATAGLLQALLPLVKHEKKPFVFWDWRLLERMRTAEGRRDAYGNCFVARMEWDGGKGAAVVRWLTDKCAEEEGV